MQIDESRTHQKNAQAPIDASLEPDSNVRHERDRQSRKESVPTFSTEEGIQIDKSEQSANADAWIKQRQEPDSKITFERVLQPQKHPTSSRLIIGGIVTSVPLPKYNFIE
jgi:hypothetical protein